MKKNTNRYNEDFKTEIIRLVREENRPVSRIVKDFGVNDQTIRNWLKQSKDKQ
ncbi:MAG: transposase, partial [Clostridium sp.]|nr:transposase [Clostridium sp.]MBS4007853.1 transposase [Clostridium sp.]MBS4009068.1 transposase [Clostridium sp.]